MKDIIRNILIDLGKNPQNIDVALTSIRKLKEENPEKDTSVKYWHPGMSSKEFKRAFLEAVKDVTFDEIFNKMPEDQMSDVARGYARLRETLNTTFKNDSVKK